MVFVGHQTHHSEATYNLCSDLVNPCFMHVHDIIHGDYHQEMNSVVFLEWFENQLMSALKNPILVVLDNASYHNVKTEDTV
jgi:transposase